MINHDPILISDATPPDDLAPSVQALWWLKKGGLIMGVEWEKAHKICQQSEGDPDCDLVHALVHWIEGNEPNAGYWYRKVGAARAATVAADWERVVMQIGDGR